MVLWVRSPGWDHPERFSWIQWRRSKLTVTLAVSVEGCGGPDGEPYGGWASLSAGWRLRWALNKTPCQKLNLKQKFQLLPLINQTPPTSPLTHTNTDIYAHSYTLTHTFMHSNHVFIIYENYVFNVVFMNLRQKITHFLACAVAFLSYFLFESMNRIWADSGCGLTPTVYIYTEQRQSWTSGRKLTLHLDRKETLKTGSVVTPSETSQDFIFYLPKNVTIHFLTAFSFFELIVVSQAPASLPATSEQESDIGFTHLFSCIFFSLFNMIYESRFHCPLNNDLTVKMQTWWSEHLTAFFIFYWSQH